MLGSTQVLGAWTHLAPELRHFISLDGSLGYASLTNTSSILKSGSGVGANIGVGYRLFYNDFLFSAGVEGLYVLNTQSMIDVQDIGYPTLYPFPRPYQDEPLNITLYVDAKDGSDICHYVNLNVPFLFGMEYRRFYFLTGPKLSVNLWGTTTTKSNITSVGDFSSEFIMPEEMVNDMVSHQFGTHYEETTNSIAWNIDVLAHLEIGMRLGDVSFQTGADVPNPKKRYYLALFVDYGLLNMRKQSSLGHDRLEYSWEEDSSIYTLTPALLSNELGKDAKVHQYTVGIKATFLFELPQKKPCVLCQDDAIK